MPRNDPEGDDRDLKALLASIAHMIRGGSRCLSLSMNNRQTFTAPDDAAWMRIDFLPGVELLLLAQPVPEGSIHRARLAEGTVIPVHTPGR